MPTVVFSNGLLVVDELRSMKAWLGNNETSEYDSEIHARCVRTTLEYDSKTGGGRKEESCCGSEWHKLEVQRHI